jgi:hypothetical protein
VLVMRKGGLIKEIDPSTSSLNDLLLAVAAEQEPERP